MEKFEKKEEHLEKFHTSLFRQMDKIEKVMLISPAPQEEMFGDESFLPLGLAYIAAVLEEHKYKVKVVDMLKQRMSEKKLFFEIETFKPQVIGFTAVTPLVNSAYRITKLIKKKYDKIITVIGGAHPTALPDESLSNNLDFVVRGEGEDTIIALLENLQIPENVKGISFKKDGKIIHNPPREYIKNLDALPFPARHLFPSLSFYQGQEALGNSMPVASTITSRGCPFHCQFCFKTVFGDRFRARSPENVVEEWTHLIEDYKVKEIAIVDDSFTTDRDRVNKICGYLIKNRLNIRWSCPTGIRVDLADYELLLKMRKAGCYRVALGVESGSQEILNNIGKRVTLEQIEDAAKNCRKVGIKTMAFFMLGNLGENRETMERTINFAIRLNTDYAQFLIAIPYPGTYLYEEIKRNGKILINDWNQYGQYEGSACFEYGDLTPKLLSEMHKKAYRKYYLNSKYLIKQLFNIETYKYLNRRIKTGLRIIFKY